MLSALDPADRPLAVVGVALAAGLSVGAAVLVMRGDDRPMINGAAHLAVFAQPATLHDERVKAAERKGGVDYAPTAVIPRAAPKAAIEGVGVVTGPAAARK